MLIDFNYFKNREMYAGISNLLKSGYHLIITANPKTKMCEGLLSVPNLEVEEQNMYRYSIEDLLPEDSGIRKALNTDYENMVWFFYGETLGKFTGTLIQSTHLYDKNELLFDRVSEVEIVSWSLNGCLKELDENLLAYLAKGGR